MNIYTNDRRSIKVRIIEEKDIPNVIKLVDNETFGCVGINEDIRPSTADTLKLLELITDKKTIQSEALVIEENNKFRGYAIIDRIKEDRYYISQIAVLPMYRRQEFGTILINVIKKLAIQDNCSIGLQCHSYEGTRFFDNLGLYRSKQFSPYRQWKGTDCKIRKELPPIFSSYQEIEEEIRKEREERVKSFSKFLKSDIGKIINKM